MPKYMTQRVFSMNRTSITYYRRQATHNYQAGPVFTQAARRAYAVAERIPLGAVEAEPLANNQPKPLGDGAVEI